MTTMTTSGGAPAASDGREREARLRRLLLVGALGSFLGFFGMTLGAGALSQPAPGQGIEPAGSGPAAPARVAAPPIRNAPHVKTRTS